MFRCRDISALSRWVFTIPAYLPTYRITHTAWNIDVDRESCPKAAAGTHAISHAQQAHEKLSETGERMEKRARASVGKGWRLLARMDGLWDGIVGS